MVYRYYLASVFIVTLLDCGAQKSPTVEDDGGEKFTQSFILGYSDDPNLNEISGIVASRKNPGYFWLHNDGVRPPDIYLVDGQMKILQTVHIQEAVSYENGATTTASDNKMRHETVKNWDWEDITIVDSKDGKTHIIVGDIGNNRANRSAAFLYKFEEPKFDGKNSEVNVIAEKMTIRYKEGPRDAEALLYDQVSGNVVIISKRDPKAKIYAFPFKATELEVSSVGQINLTQIVAGDANAKGDVLIKNYGHVFLITNEGNKSIVESLLEGTFEEVNYIEEPQGESLCWGLDNASYYTTSERRYKKPEPLYLYE